MMTQQRKKRLQNKIQQSRERLMGTHPFFALLLMYLKFVALPGMKKISTNGRCIYFSPEYLDKLYAREMDYILCHQIMHIICGHIWRPPDLAGEGYHLACDVLSNLLLTQCGFSEERYAHLGQVRRAVPGLWADISTLTPKEIYDRIPFQIGALDERTRNKFLPDSDCRWDDKEDGTVGELILDIPYADGMVRESGKTVDGADSTAQGGSALQQTWKARLALAVSSSEMGKKGDGGIGSAPSFAKRMLQRMKQPKMDWKKILNLFVQEQICDYSFCPPDRRFADTGFFLPDFNEKDFVCKDIFFMVDTSGSVSDDDLELVYGELQGAICQFNGRLRGRLGFFDTRVTPPLPFESVGDLLDIIPYGGGGTDFRVIFEYIRDHHRDTLPSCVVIFTDGAGPYPDEWETMDIPVLWILNNEEVTPPFGKIARRLL